MSSGRASTALCHYLWFGYGFVTLPCECPAYRGSYALEVVPMHSPGGAGLRDVLLPSLLSLCLSALKLMFSCSVSKIIELVFLAQ